MRGKKLYPGDKFSYEGQTYLITIHAAQSADDPGLPEL